MWRGYGGLQREKYFLRSSEGRRAEGARGKTWTIIASHPALELSSAGAKQPPF